MNKNKFFQWFKDFGNYIVCGLLAFVMLVLMVVYSFEVEKYKNYNNSVSASSFNLSTADVVVNDYTLETDVFTCPCLVFQSSSLSNLISSDRMPSYFSFKLKFYLASDGSWQFGLKPISANIILSSSNEYTFYDLSSTTYSYFFTSSNADTSWHAIPYEIPLVGYGRGYLIFEIKSSTVNFNSSVSSLKLNTKDGAAGHYSVSCIDFRYSNNNKFEFQVIGQDTQRFSSVNYVHLSFPSDRYIYILPNMTDNDYYNAGYDYGFREGQSQGEELGYQNGSRDGQIIGEEVGYRKGVADANTYSFGNFFAGLFDAPVVMVYNALNFDLLGVNLYTFFCGLITVFLCIALIKFIRGK